MASTKNSSSKNGAPLKQGTLSFASAKRTNSSTIPKTTKKPPRPRRSSSAIEQVKGRVNDTDEVEANDDEHSNDVLEISSEEEFSQASTISAKPGRTTAPKSVITNVTVAPVSRSAKKRKGELSPIKPVEQRPSLDLSAKKYREHYGRVREKMGNLEPIHAEGQNKVHEILRVFDMSYEYGPCVGMTRLERWERAASFGLNPPEEVRDILLTREGVDMDEYSQCVLYGEV